MKNTTKNSFSGKQKHGLRFYKDAFEALFDDPVEAEVERLKARLLLSKQRANRESRAEGKDF